MKEDKEDKHKCHSTYFISGDISKRHCKDCNETYFGFFAELKNKEEYKNNQMYKVDIDLYERDEQRRVEIRKHINHKTRFSSMLERYCEDCKSYYYDYIGNGKDFRGGKFSILGIYGDDRPVDPQAVKNIRQLMTNFNFPNEGGHFE